MEPVSLRVKSIPSSLSVVSTVIVRAESSKDTNAALAQVALVLESVKAYVTLHPLILSVKAVKEYV
jgi:hypothetical protein